MPSTQKRIFLDILQEKKPTTDSKVLFLEKNLFIEGILSIQTFWIQTRLRTKCKQDFSFIFGITWTSLLYPVFYFREVDNDSFYMHLPSSSHILGSCQKRSKKKMDVLDVLVQVIITSLGVYKGWIFHGPFKTILISLRRRVL